MTLQWRWGMTGDQIICSPFAFTAVCYPKVPAEA
jgi:hypothetical protein